MKALILAAGLGTRLKPITNRIPKCLVPIHGRPLLGYWLQMLKDAGIECVLINTHYLHENIMSFLKSQEYYRNIIAVYEEKLLGTGGTLLKNLNFFSNSQIMMIHADNLSKFDMTAFIEAHHCRPACCEITMMTFRSETPKSCGIVELDDNGIVQAFHEKTDNPPSNLANGAVYILEPSVLQLIESLDKTEIDFSTEILPRFLGKINTFYNDIYHRDIGTVESYQKALVEFPVKWS